MSEAEFYSSAAPATTILSDSTWPLLVVVAGYHEAKDKFDLSLIPPHVTLEMKRPPHPMPTYFEFLHRIRPALAVPTRFPLIALHWDSHFSKFQPLTPATIEATLDGIMRAVLAGNDRKPGGVRASCFISIQIDFEEYKK